MWIAKSFEELTVDEFYACEKLRLDTFVVEQGIKYSDLDATDKEAYHIAYIENGVCLAYARLFKEKGHPHFGRVATALAARGKGYGGELIRQILAKSEALWPGEKIEIEAQHQVVGLYEKFGFESVGDTFILEGIVHQKMVQK